MFANEGTFTGFGQLKGTVGSNDTYLFKHVAPVKKKKKMEKRA